jgi:type I restriction enzyme M protein
MLDAETKRHIDNARDVLVGKVPDPKAQIEMITIALIYKFMDDMDKASVEMGGKPSFFTGQYKEYTWTKLMDIKMSGVQRIKLYSEALEKMPENKNLPQLFRDILKDAYLPFKDPETLNLFLKDIAWFDYEHSENLGNAFEYLLSIMSSQGAAGQFRTPRHIIDFMVDVIVPEKNETILDPACGTAGFLISAYNYILTENTKKNKGDKLSPEDRKKLSDDIVGYDISPDMVRLSRVNLYLHGFKTPKIYEYDTLTSEDRWNDNFDVILANPPFMTPKGGIRPHKKFAIQANRSEALFVDYIMEHINLRGRAAIIVPEGIIFKSDNAFTSLRKKLVDENYLWAVVSLPAGVFNPYSGVKTSILFLDKEISKKVKEVLFVKVMNDGFDLGAQRREIELNNLPDAIEAMKMYKEKVEKGIATSKDVKKSDVCEVVTKVKLAENGEYNLTAEKYIEKNKINHDKWEMVKLEDLLEYEQPTKYIVKSVEYNDEYKIPVLTAGKTFILGYTNEKGGIYNGELPVIIFDDFTTAIKLVDFPFKVKSSAMKLLHPNNNKASAKYIFNMMKKIQFSSSTHKRYWISEYSKVKIPLPPLEIQREIVSEIEGYQKIIDGARMVVDNWKPRIDIDQTWPVLRLGEVCEVNPKKAEINNIDSKTIVSFLPMEDLRKRELYCYPVKTRNLSEVYKGYTYFKENDVLVAKVTPCFENGKSGIATKLKNGIGFGSSELHVIRPNDRILVEFIYPYIIDEQFISKGKDSMTGTGGLQRVPASYLEGLQISLPSINIQNNIVERIKVEQKSVNCCREMIKIYENKIKQVIDKVWG